MLRPRGLIISAVVLMALVGGAYWSEQTKKEEEAKGSSDSPKLISISDDQLQQIEIKRKDGETTVLKRADGKWQMTAPQPLPVDQDAAGTLASTVSSLASDRVVEEKAGDLAVYGLDAPGLEVAVTAKDGKLQKAQIGDETPTGSAWFARIDGDPRIFTIAGFNRTSLDKTHKDLRDKRLLPFDSEKLSRVELSAKGPAIEFGKNNRGEWQILKPRPLRADGGHVEELVRRLQDAKMDTSVPDEEMKKAPALFASGSRVAVAKVTDAGGMREIEVRKKGDDYYAKSTAVDGVFKIASDIGQGLDKGLDDFRNTSIFDFGFNDLSKVEVRDGDKSYSFAKSGEKWMAGQKEMDAVSVQNAIDKLRDLKAAKFVEKPFPAAVPALDITVSWEEGKRTDKVQLAKDGDNYLARRDGEPSVYQVEAAAVEELQKAAADVKPPQPSKKEEKK